MGNQAQPTNLAITIFAKPNRTPLKHTNTTTNTYRKKKDRQKDRLDNKVHTFTGLRIACFFHVA